MFTGGVRWIGLITILVCSVSRAQATPITYTFSGTFEQPYNGSTQFSGTLTYDTDLPVFAGIQSLPGTSYYTTVPADPSEPPASLTFNLGSTPSSSFGTISWEEVIVTHTQSNDEFSIEEQFVSQSSSGGEQSELANFSLLNNNLVQRAPFGSTNLPSSLKPADFSMGTQLDVVIAPMNGPQVTLVGHVDTFGGETIAPEPASLVVFGLLGAGLWASRRASNRLRSREIPMRDHDAGD